MGWLFTVATLTVAEALGADFWVLGFFSPQPASAIALHAQDQDQRAHSRAAPIDPAKHDYPQRQ
ncbi:hypothetical protein ACRAWD_31165 [Caulobacter segnis]